MEFIQLDWDNFILNIITTFLGVIFALILQRVYDKTNEKEEANNLKSKIEVEIKRIWQSLLDIEISNKMVIDPIKMPIYDGLISSTKISLLDRYEWYDDLIAFYDEIHTYNNWCNFRLKFCRNEDKKEVDNIIKSIENHFLGDKNKRIDLIKLKNKALDNMFLNHSADTGLILRLFSEISK